MNILLDTNVIIEHLASGLLNESAADVEFSISVITEAELFRFSGLGTKEIRVIEKFLEIIEIISVTSSIAKLAAKLGRTRKTPLPDLLIAATAIENNLPLFTRNIKDFQRIPNLHILKEL